jgi:hypothetical protein
VEQDEWKTRTGDLVVDRCPRVLDDRHVSSA